MAGERHPYVLPEANGQRPIIEDPLTKYASTQMLVLHSKENNVRLHQQWWVEVMQGQHDLGLPIPQDHVDDYRAVQDVVDLEDVRRIELIRRHDEKAMIESNNGRAGHEEAQEGLTSRDNSDNIEQYRNREGLLILRDRNVATLARYARLAAENATLYIANRTHLVPAQSDLVARFFSTFGEEVLYHHANLEHFIENYPLRGLKGAMGTQTDQLQLFDGDAEKVQQLEKRLADFLGFDKVMGSVFQVYPRSLDYDMISRMFGLVSGHASLALTLRQMAGRDQFTEGFQEGQTGSAGMPHKTNARSSERFDALKKVMQGFITMAAANSGSQLYGGDVSCSAVRRVFLPGSFFATDGMFQTILTVLDECGFYPAVIEEEYNKYLPFLTSTRFLMAAVKNGVGRETAHRAIGEHSKAHALELKEKGKTKTTLIEKLANEPVLGLSQQQLEDAIADRETFVGTAPQQVVRFIQKVEDLVAKHPEAAAYNPEPIL